MIILVPVPCRHLDSALGMRSERIAFGTDATHFFNNEEITRGTPVLIYASRKSAGAAHLFVKRRATFEARFEKWLKADNTGMHLRASEFVALRWDDIDFQTGKLHVRRAKGGTAVHPIGGLELRALRRLKREAPASVYVFVSERLAPQRSRLSAHGRAGWRGRGLPLPRSQPHAAAFLRLQTRKRRPGHPGDPALPWAQVDQLDRPLHGSGAGSLQRLLEGLSLRTIPARRPKADMCGATRVVRFGPKADIRPVNGVGLCLSKRAA